MEEYIKKSELKTRINKILDDIENYLVESESEKTKIGYETGYKDGVNQTLQAIKCHLQNSMQELNYV